MRADVLTKPERDTNAEGPAPTPPGCGWGHPGRSTLSPSVSSSWSRSSSVCAALSAGFRVYGAIWSTTRHLHSILLTLTVVPVALVAECRVRNRGRWRSRGSIPRRTVLTTLIDLPFSVSPVVAGCFVLIFVRQATSGRSAAVTGTR